MNVDSETVCLRLLIKGLIVPIKTLDTVCSLCLKAYYFNLHLRMLSLFDASILLLFTVELVPLLCITVISVKSFVKLLEC